MKQRILKIPINFYTYHIASFKISKPCIVFHNSIGCFFRLPSYQCSVSQRDIVFVHILVKITTKQQQQQQQQETKASYLEL